MKNLWSDRRGAGLIPAIGLAFVLLLAGAAIIEALRLQSTAKAVRDAVQAATVETCEEQYADIYDGTREGYSGGYSRKSGSWSEALSPADVYARLDTGLGTRTDGGSRVKYAGSDVNYRLSGLSAQITNAPFAPSGEDADQLTCTAEVDLEVPLMLHWDGVPPMRIHLIVKGGYMPKF